MKAFVRLILVAGLAAVVAGVWQNWRRSAPNGGGSGGVDPAAGARSPGAESGTWAGTWRNRKAGTSGRLECRAEPLTDKEWRARFTGEFKGKPFSYEIRMRSRRQRGGTGFSGKARVGSDRYTWSGEINGDVFTGAFKSRAGNHGEFRLTR